jgi:hypothetical protein
LEGVKGDVPELVLASLSELAEHGLSSMSMHALPMPAGSVPLRDAEDELTGARLSLFEEEQENARLRLALQSARRGRRELRAQVAALRDERHSTNEALSDAAERMRADRDRIAELEALKPAAIHGVSRPSVEWVAETFSPKPASRDDDPNGLHHTYRVGRDLPELGGQR